MEEAYASIEKLYKSSSRVSAVKGADSFVADVQAYVRELGYEAVQATERGAFNLDLAIVNPKTGLFAVGVECDAPRHPLLQGAYHREVWRKAILRRSIGVIHRISSRDWYQDRARQQDLLREVVISAIGQGDDQ